MTLRAEEARAKGEEPRRIQTWVPLSHMSPELRRAVLIAEDDAFFQHEGVDFEQLRLSLQADWARGRFDRGASTITQQLAKNLYLSPSKNPLRKFRELVIARRLEAELDEGSHPRAVPERHRVGRRHLRHRGGVADLLSPARPRRSGRRKSALLAGAIINPRRLNPAHPTKRLLRRQKLILQRMRSGVPAGTRPPSERKIEPPKPEEEEKLDDSEDRRREAGGIRNRRISSRRSDVMALDRVRTAAALLLLACLALPAYTCDGHGYIGPGGEKVDQRIASYPLESGTREPVRNSLVVLAYSWPVLFFAYRRRRAPAAIPGGACGSRPCSPCFLGFSS